MKSNAHQRCRRNGSCSCFIFLVSSLVLQYWYYLCFVYEMNYVVPPSLVVVASSSSSISVVGVGVGVGDDGGKSNDLYPIIGKKQSISYPFYSGHSMMMNDDHRVDDDDEEESNKILSDNTVIAMKYSDGIIIASDSRTSFGNVFKMKNLFNYELSLFTKSFLCGFYLSSLFCVFLA